MDLAADWCLQEKLQFHGLDKYFPQLPLLLLLPSEIWFRALYLQIVVTREPHFCPCTHCVRNVEAIYFHGGRSWNIFWKYFVPNAVLLAGGNQENIYWSDKPGFIWDPIQILETRNLELSEWQYNSLMLHLHIKAEYGPPWNFTVPGGCLHLGWQCRLVLSTIKNLSIVRTLVNAFNKMAAFLGHCKISWSLVCTALLDIDHVRRCRGGNDDVDAAPSIVM